MCVLNSWHASITLYELKTDGYVCVIAHGQSTGQHVQVLYCITADALMHSKTVDDRAVVGVTIVSPDTSHWYSDDRVLNVGAWRGSTRM